MSEAEEVVGYVAVLLTLLGTVTSSQEQRHLESPSKCPEQQLTASAQCHTTQPVKVEDLTEEQLQTQRRLAKEKDLLTQSTKGAQCYASLDWRCNRTHPLY